MSHWKG